MKLRTLFLIPVLLAVINAAPDKFEFDGMRYVGDIVKSFDVGSNGELVMERITGDVTIEGEARNDIVVVEKFKIDAYSEASAQKILTDEKARFLQKGNRVTVTGSDFTRRYTSDFMIKVPFSFNVDVSVSGGDVTISAIVGSQKINTSGGDVDIEECRGVINGHTSGGDIQAQRAEGEMNIVTSGGDIVVKDFNGSLRASTSGGDICLNRIQASGQVHTSGGDIDIVNLRAKTFTARTSGGDIGADKVESDLNMTTSGGDIIIGQVVGNVEVHTSGGDIEVRQIDKNLKATTSGGDINIGLVKGYCYVRTSGGDIEVDRAYDLEAITSGGGDITAHKLLKPNVSNNAIDLETSGGDIEVYLPSEINANIDAEITITDRSNADVSIHSDFPLKKSQDMKSSRIYLYASGPINKGGDLVRLRTVNGAIVISKYNPEHK
jgi:hypothetical protein